MADKSFEQRVKEEMASLRVKPDPVVWVEVEAALHKDTKRRRLIWLFLLLAGCSGAAFWYYMQRQQSDHIITSNEKSSIVAKNEAEKKQNSTLEENKPLNEMANPGYVRIVPGLIAFSKKTGKTDKVQTPVLLEKTHTPLNSVMPMVAKKTIHTDTMIRAPFSPPTDTIHSGGVRVDKKLPLQPPVEITAMIDTVLPVVQEPPFKKMSEDSQVAVNAPGVILQKPKKNQWQWNIRLITGKSGIRRAAGLLFKNDSYARDAANSGLSSVPIFPGTGSSQNLYKLPSVKDAFSFSVNVEATKQLTKKHVIGVSLGYGLYQSTIGIGRRVDSTVFMSNYGVNNASGFYYLSTDSVTYTNRYHFLQAAFDGYIPFRLFNALSLRGQLGAGFNILFSSNGLHYASSNNLLFTNRALLKTVQMSISTGFDVAIGKQPFLYVGPQWQYFISNLSRQSGTNQHFFRSGVKFTVILPAKEKNKMQR